MAAYKLTSKSSICFLSLLCSAVYFCNYMARLTFSTVVAEIVRSENMAATAVSLVVVVQQVTYCSGQLLSGVLGDRLDPRRLITGGLLVGALTNLLMPLVHSAALMAVIWGCNGLALAMIWPPMVKILTGLLKIGDFQRVSVQVSIASMAASMAIYLIAPLGILLGSWRYVFYFSALLTAGVALLWALWLPRLERTAVPAEEEAVQQKQSAGSAWKLLLSAELLCIMLAIVFQGALRDGVITWVPSYLVDTFHLGTSLSIFSSVVLPLFNILSYLLVSVLYRRWLHNELGFSALLFGGSAAAALALGLLPIDSPLAAVLLAAVVTACSNGVNLLLICMVPARLARFGRASTVSGVLNTCTHLGSALSSYGIVVLAQRYGWQATILSWSLMAVAGLAFCAAGVRRWKSYCQDTVSPEET
ncbi:MAG TPA: MFS transporter [Firmicutes bacterium]|nr:MFS transporter [Bacillota bacterium]